MGALFYLRIENSHASKVRPFASLTVVMRGDTYKPRAIWPVAVKVGRVEGGGRVLVGMIGLGVVGEVTVEGDQEEG